MWNVIDVNQIRRYFRSSEHWVREDRMSVSHLSVAAQRLLQFEEPSTKTSLKFFPLKATFIPQSTRLL